VSPASGSLGSLANAGGADGCTSQTGNDDFGDPCQYAPALPGGWGSIVPSPDGQSVYAAGGGTHGSSGDIVTALRRNPIDGQLVQYTGPAACGGTPVAATVGPGTCFDIPATANEYFVSDMAMSPDGRSLYSVFGPTSSLLNGLARQPDQLLGLLPCVSTSGNGQICVKGRALRGAYSVATSRDGRNVYVASYTSDGIGIFSRDPGTGYLAQASGTQGCVEDGAHEGCEPGYAMNGATSVAIAPDGKTVYVGSHDGIAWYTRTPPTSRPVRVPSGGHTILTAGRGQLHFRFCLTNSGSSRCGASQGVTDATALAVSPDGNTLYALDRVGVQAFAIDSQSDLTPIGRPSGGCYNATGASSCRMARGLQRATDLAVSPDSANVYVSSSGTGGVDNRNGNAVLVFDRKTSGSLTGRLTQQPGTAGCLSITTDGGQCGNGIGLRLAATIAVTPDGANVYVGGPGTVAVFQRATS
jgi:DNA-binding beta-propeller fold protein YncE